MCATFSSSQTKPVIQGIRISLSSSMYIVEACVERVRAYVEAGAAEIVLYPLCDPAEWPRQLDGLAAVAAQVKGGT